ncbi:hypothetical protein DYB32_000806 [Aphanomyces invadans]|uniref:Double-strand break repair protein n=1 Tax=Aphanomyces invadans TaxID=157072 RepID=A0A3R6VHI5_9STRA|nr:hypothetical protein DYB32_000806 [Aphanomyces invadans]
MKILISTDNHLGYNENDAVRGKDSFRAFEEMLAIGGREQVDFVLLAGDLFHHNKPSRATMYRTMSILRTYCLGDGTINFQILSDQSLNFPNYGQVNYEDPNINVRLPIFSIHGNHDDPTGEAGRSLAALDLLSAANLVNYFGKSDRVDEIEVFPILLEKGSTKVAIYGLGNMRDERLHRMFAQGHVRFRRPEESPDSWFSIFVVHQNRDNRGRGAKNCLPESFIPEFIDFVVWGHEHECVIEAEESIKGDFYITQPGSSVATSLVEAKPKKIGVLEILDNNFRYRAVPLKTVRPFKMAEVCLRDHKHLDPSDPKVGDKISALLARKVQDLIDEEAAENPRADRQDTAMQMLVRIKVEHTGFPVLSNQRFGGQFVGKVANPADILLFSRGKKASADPNDDTKSTTSSGSLKNPIRPGPPNAAATSILGVEQLLSSHLAGSEKVLEILPETNLAHALEDFVFKNVSSAFSDIYDTVLEESQGALKMNKGTLNKHDIQTLVEKNLERLRAAQAVHAGQSSMDTNEVMRMLQSGAGNNGDDNDGLIDSDGDEPDQGSDGVQVVDPPRVAAKSRGGSRGDKPANSSSRRPPTPAKPKGKTRKEMHNASDLDEVSAYDDDDVVNSSESDFDTPSKKQPPAKRKAAPKRQTATSKRKPARSPDTSPRHQPTARKKPTTTQKTISDLFSQTSHLPSTNAWREAGGPTQVSTQSSTQATSRRKLPLSFSSYTQDDEVKSSVQPPSSAKGWGRPRK